jgi:hypothetical protein
MIPNSVSFACFDVVYERNLFVRKLILASFWSLDDRAIVNEDVC